MKVEDLIKYLENHRDYTIDVRVEGLHDNWNSDNIRFDKVNTMKELTLVADFGECVLVSAKEIEDLKRIDELKVTEKAYEELLETPCGCCCCC